MTTQLQIGFNPTMTEEDQYYPTPISVIKKMLELYKSYNCYSEWDDDEDDDESQIKSNKRNRSIKYPILDPSAGEGAILAYLKDEMGLRSGDVFGIEIDPDRRMTLRDKFHRVLDSDFLSYREDREFGLIIMNPPFVTADTHILHAWQFVAGGGDLVALCNSETINNPYTKKRQLLANLIEEYSIVPVEDLGQCFLDSDRPTGVNVSLIRLTKPKVEPVIDFGTDKFQQDNPVTDEEFSANPLAHPDLIKALVDQYNTARRLIIERGDCTRKIDFYLNGISSVSHEDRGDYDRDTLETTSRMSVPDQLDIVKERFWMTVFNRARIASRLTEKFKRDFNTFRRSQKDMAFTVTNIEEMLFMFFGNYNEIMLQCLVDVFDTMTKFHPENKVHPEGWKSNTGHKVEQYKLSHKVIHPYGVKFCNILNRFEAYNSQGFLSDLDKVLCWLEGVSYHDMTSYESSYGTLSRRCSQLDRNPDRREYGQKIYSRYLEIQLFKKGTIHLRFRDTDLLKEFNIKAAQGKKWIGGDGF